MMFEDNCRKMHQFERTDTRASDELKNEIKILVRNILKVHIRQSSFT